MPSGNSRGRICFGCLHIGILCCTHTNCGTSHVFVSRGKCTNGANVQIRLVCLANSLDAILKITLCGNTSRLRNIVLPNAVVRCMIFLQLMWLYVVAMSSGIARVACKA